MFDSLKNRIYRRATGRGAQPGGVQVSLPALLYFLWKRGGPAALRGSLLRHRFKECGGRLFIGKRTETFFLGQVTLGRNVYLGDYVYLNGLAREGMKIGSNVRIREYGWIQASSSLSDTGVGLVIGDNTYIGPRCVLGAGGGIHIGHDVTIGAAVDLLAEDHRFEDADRPINEQGVNRRGIVIEDDVWIGNRATVLDGVRVGRGAVIGAAAVVTKDVPPFSIVVGNPARVVRFRDGAVPGPVVVGAGQSLRRDSAARL